MISAIAKAFGFLLMGLAFAQWITFDYPDVNPFWSGAIFAPGMLSQFVNWIVVCVIGASGWGLFQYGRSRSSNPDRMKGTE
ncbi:hypothetical protein BTA51_19240 [Hahella sp. CCB-MM4]|uniref:hypothetical protein n=1 Tax=Hahella sp. (strain CCB-MM4) TaxID=1926491 RepID=UPI000B9C0677|nr:hypothetical protein [Hahella sp. CCB-MM4]OZG71772.1 hypothetical protein BTA51_19240 [Hahella sp. CCB-MM4]